MYPHDYYNGDSQPYLHNHEEGGLYVEPDYWANEVDSQLPLLSTIGRGPQGVGLYVGNTVDEDGNVSFALYSDDTHEVVWQSPNLAAAQIEFSSDDYRDIVPGEPAQLTITQKRGGTTKTDIAYIPCGTQGSLVYLLNVERERSKDDTYTATVSELTIYDQSAYPSKPTPRVNDIVYFTYHSETEYGFAFGTIEAVEGDTVVFTARTFIAMPPVTIGANGNWYVDGKDTKVQAKGEKGDKGDKGDKGATGAKGNKGDKGDKGDAGKNAKVSVGTTTQLEPGAKATVSNSSKEEGSAILDFGIPEGKPAKLAQVDVTNIEPGEKAYGEVEQISSNENSYKLNLGLPRGEDGKTFDVMNGVWSLEDLPEFDETPINTVYVVEDEDGTHHYYIRGRIAYDAELGGPWTVVDVMNYDNLNDVPLKLVDGKWVSQRGGVLPVEWGSNNGTQASMGGSSATGLYAHAEGLETVASGRYSHAEGDSTKASAPWSHAEGANTTASGEYSHAEGQLSKALGAHSHAEGGNTTASGGESHAEGSTTTASGQYSHAEGERTTAQGASSHAEGYKTTASGGKSHAEGFSTIASGDKSHAEGASTEASGDYSHAEGSFTTASGNRSHAEGASTTASGDFSHAEGSTTTASGEGSHAEGINVNASGNYSHAEGGLATASGYGSHAEGNFTIAASSYQHVQGQYNVKDTAQKYAHIVGGGTSDTDRKNIHTLDWSGNADYAGDVVSHDAQGTAHSLNAKANAEDLIWGQSGFYYGDDHLWLPYDYVKKPAKILCGLYQCQVYDADGQIINEDISIDVLLKLLADQNLIMSWSWLFAGVQKTESGGYELLGYFGETVDRATVVPRWHQFDYQDSVCFKNILTSEVTNIANTAELDQVEDAKNFIDQLLGKE